MHILIWNTLYSQYTLKLKNNIFCHCSITSDLNDLNIKYGILWISGWLLKNKISGLPEPLTAKASEAFSFIVLHWLSGYQHDLYSSLHKQSPRLKVNIISSTLRSSKTQQSCKCCISFLDSILILFDFTIFAYMWLRYICDHSLQRGGRDCWSELRW